MLVDEIGVGHRVDGSKRTTTLGPPWGLPLLHRTGPLQRVALSLLTGQAPGPLAAWHRSQAVRREREAVRLKHFPVKQVAVPCQEGNV